MALWAYWRVNTAWMTMVLFIGAMRIALYVRPKSARLSRVLERDDGWYCDFRSDDEVFVVFCDRVFRYRRGDRTARSTVEDYARSVGVPEAQLDWPG